MNTLSPELLAQIYKQESEDPFLTLLTLDHTTFPSPIRFVNNSESIISRGETYLPFPMTITLPKDDGESTREFAIEFDNVGLDLIDELRTVTDYIDVTLEMVLASIPDAVQISFQELKIQSVSYTKTRVSARLFLDNFLNTQISSERYTPSNFPGIF